MHAYLYQITPMVRLRKDCDAYAVTRKYEFALGMLDQILTNSEAYLDNQTRDHLLEWITEALVDIRDHSDVLAETLREEALAIEHATFATFQISRYERQAKEGPPFLRKASKEAAEYWRAVARESEPQTPRAERIITLLRERYRW